MTSFRGARQRERGIRRLRREISQMRNCASEVRAITRSGMTTNDFQDYFCGPAAGVAALPVGTAASAVLVDLVG
jgi:hypothetical protein